MVALSIGLSVSAAAFLFLEGGRTAFARELKVAEINANARWAIERVSADLTAAGTGAPSETAILWHDGAPGDADRITILYADPDAPIARARRCEGACEPADLSSRVILSSRTMNPAPVDYETAYAPGAILLAVESALAGPACAAARPAIVWFQLTDRPQCSGDSGEASGAEDCAALALSHGGIRGLAAADVPRGFGTEVDLGCAYVGAFHAVQYRLFSGVLERRDLLGGDQWTRVAGDIDDFQLQYSQGFQGGFQDAPSTIPSAFDPGTWFTAVRVTVAGGSGNAPFVHRSLSTTVSLRSQLGQASLTPGVEWN